MKPKEIAEKYVYGTHDALTDNQEIKDMVFDIEEYAKDYCAKSVKLGRVKAASVILSGIIASASYVGYDTKGLVKVSYEFADELMRQGKCINLK